MPLTAIQQIHVAKVFADSRADMARYLEAGADVVIQAQDEVPEVPPYAIVVAGTDFWIDCCATAEEASAFAAALGLRVIH